MKKAFIYVVACLIAVSTITSASARTIVMLNYWGFDQRGRYIHYTGWVDPDGHGFSTGDGYIYISWKKINPNSETPPSTHVSSIEELLKEYAIEAEDDGVPIDLKENASFIVNMFNEANDQANRKE